MGDKQCLGPTADIRANIGKIKCFLKEKDLVENDKYIIFWPKNSQKCTF